MKENLTTLILNWNLSWSVESISKLKFKSTELNPSKHPVTEWKLLNEVKLILKLKLWELKLTRDFIEIHIKIVSDLKKNIVLMSNEDKIKLKLYKIVNSH